MTSCLIVANQTIGGTELTAAVRERIDHGTSTFVLVVPAVADASSSSPISSTPNRSSAVDVTDGRKLAEQRLANGLEWLVDLGVEANGEVSADDTVVTVRQIVEDQSIDEVLVSTLPSGVSRFLRQDLASKIGRSISVPVATVTARS